MIGGRILDADAVASAITGRLMYARALVAAAATQGNVIVILCAALVGGLARVPDGVRRQGAAVLLAVPVVVVEPLDQDRAVPLAELMAAARPPSGDLVTAAVVLSARRRGWPIVSGRARELLALDAAVEIDRLPRPAPPPISPPAPVACIRRPQPARSPRPCAWW
ncbi:hypothetical protein [Actinomadura gamaensis]|uniref:PIN domain-containing protein n=1 Tax=Actinomadura gamaensis TaxID=1763541 RepID=A0ABV9U0F9_9ACTN